MSAVNLLLRSRAEPGQDGLLVSVTPEVAGWRYVGFDVYRLGRGARLERDTSGHEVCAVMLSGRADLAYGGDEWRGLGGRPTVFDGVGDSLYAPPGDTLTVSATTDACEVALCWAPAKRGAAPALIRAADVKVFKRGSGRTERTIHNILMEDDRSLDQALQVRDGDVVMVPRGYHPVAAGPGYDLYYLNVMAGPERRWLVTTDPNHTWQLD